VQLDEVNRTWYSGERAVSACTADSFLEPALVFILLTYRDAILGQPVLDIGVGGGRTTLYLSQLTSDYVGIDYSPPMVAHCHARFPGVRLEVCDARDLSRFDDGSFRLVLFSFNGIDAVDHEGRMQALAEIARVLQPGGIFAFSSHNRNCRPARRRPALEWTRNPFAFAASVARWLGQRRTHSRLAPLEAELPEYALVNDGSEDYSLIHYYLTKEEQRRQLEKAGLLLVEMFDSSAKPVSEQSDDSASPSIWYVARKAR
jgi:SAM-dependent methyltransferase